MCMGGFAWKMHGHLNCQVTICAFKICDTKGLLLSPSIYNRCIYVYGCTTLYLWAITLLVDKGLTLVFGHRVNWVTELLWCELFYTAWIEGARRLNCLPFPRYSFALTPKMLNGLMLNVALPVFSSICLSIETHVWSIIGPYSFGHYHL